MARSDSTPKALRRAAEGDVHPKLATGFDRLLSVQRPVVLAHIRGIRSRHPQASPAEVIAILEKRYLAAVTTGGAAVGAASAIPAVGIGASVALSGVETAGFLEVSALFAQSVTEVHGIPVTDPDRARTLVMTMMLGGGGVDLLKQFAGQAAGAGVARSAFWGEMVSSALPSGAVGVVADRLKSAFLKRFAASQGAGVVGRTLPFGIGAVVGGTGSHLLGRKVVTSSRTAFGPAPVVFPAELEPRVLAPGERRGPRLPLPRRRRAGAAETDGTALVGDDRSGTHVIEWRRRDSDELVTDVEESSEDAARTEPTR
ncbi:hypothetical protein [Schumannella soli]|uniref:hypothetical protein n=1 Tax=Schumannella soli TaxID=2590779 RepID=UPI002106EF56|nr:hypothetical protein [Schumannella soli]